MIRLHMIVEGQTEEAFANRVLVPHLAHFNVFADAQLLTSRLTRHSRRFKGGWNAYSALKKHLMQWNRMDGAEQAWFTTMLDLYALPSDCPGFENVVSPEEPLARVLRLEEAFRLDAEMAGVRRLVPYLQLHEFEALILADPQHLDWEFLEHDAQIRRITAMAGSFENPEMINSDPDTAPSKRIIAEIPEYEARKASAGPTVAERIGLNSLRVRCPHFHSWVSRIEQLDCDGHGSR
ncbi:MAG: DUF4276 family protein [Azospirillaceae bacterium]|nr:DUF4276 family protein [Azospirillaceae bacterium]